MNNHLMRLAPAVALALAGCASFSPDGGRDAVSALTKERTGHAVGVPQAQAQARVAELLAAPLSADSAVELALLNNRGLQASFSQLGVAEADLVQAGRLRNPVFGFGRLSGGGVVEIERSLMFDLLGLLTMPAAQKLQQGRFEQSQLQAAYDAVGVAADARRAFYAAVAAQQLVAYAQQVHEAAEASSELARRMQQAGNFNKLDRMREQSFLADATADLARATQQAVATRERLTRVLGLERSSFTLPGRLPDLPPQPIDARDAEQTALDQRLDLRMARRGTEATAQALGLANATRFVNALELGYQNKSETGEPRSNGYELELEIPLFDFGGVRTARAEATYMQSVHRTAQVAVDARSEVRESYANYRTGYALARHYRDEVVPLRQRISEENLLRYNGMLIGVFELLADARDQVRGVTGYVQALRDFWIADTDLRTALTGRSPGAAAANAPTAAAEPARGGH